MGANGAAFSPLTAGVLVEASGFEGAAGDEVTEGVEEQQVGFKFADFVGDGSAFLPLALGELPAGAVDDGRGVASPAAADVHADDFSVDPAGAGVIASAIGTGFPGHGGGFSKAAHTKGRYTQATRALVKGWTHAWGKYRV